MIKKLIVNADDFGITEGVTIGILHTHADGIVTSTTTMMNMPAASFAIKQAEKFPKLGVGIHFVLTVGRPLVDGATTFTDENGNFKRPNQYDSRHPETDNIEKFQEELYIEWKAQMEKFIEVAGKKPTHIDSHHHAHLLPIARDVAIKLAHEYDLPLRQREKIYDKYEYVRCADKMYNDLVNYDFLTSEFDTDEDTIEFMCHPAYIDQPLYDSSSYCLQRMKEMELLRSDEVKKFVKDNNIELINYSDLKKQG